MTKQSKQVKLLHQKVDVVVRAAVYSTLYNLMAGAEMLVISYLTLLPQTRTSNPISKLLRPIMEHKRVRTILGANLAGMLILVGSTATPSAAEVLGQPEVKVVDATDVVVTTEQRFGLPVAQLTGISQGFSLLHRGVDMRAPLGTAVVPITSGRVVEVKTSKLGYGNHVVVGHEGALNSLYAHLGVISVKVGQEVTQEVQLGTVGVSGWTTGPHLHLEVYDRGQAANPLTIVPLE